MSPILTGVVASQITGHLSTNSYESIATVTVGSGGQSSISFSSIPSTYKHLQIRGILRGDRSGQTEDVVGVQFNSDTTSANYVSHRLVGDGSTAGAGPQASGTYSSAWCGYATAATASANIFGAIVMDVLDYTSTAKNKVARSLGGDDRNGAGTVIFESSLWLSTSAITSLTIVPVFGTNFVQYSQLALYGIKG